VTFVSCSGAVTVGLDIGTTSVKAAAFDDDGAVLARARVPHRVLAPAPELLEHDAERAWRRGPRRALAALGAAGAEARAVAVSSMVPSLAAVDRRGRPLSPGLLYGDARGRTESITVAGGAGELVEFLRWSAAKVPEAAGYWPAPAVANMALGGRAVVDIGVAFSSIPLYGSDGWDARVCSDCGVSPEQLPAVEMFGTPVGRVGRDGPLLATGSVDVFCEQMTAGADQEGDLHVLCGTTLLPWVVSSTWKDVPGLWTMPHPSPGLVMIGGASNAGGLFLDWVRELLGRPRGNPVVDPRRVPVWIPYLRGERTPYQDPDRRGALAAIDLTHGPAALQRAAWEASAFVARHHLELAGIPGRRIVATGGGTRVPGWMQALADVINLPVHVAAVPEGAAQGAAFLARVAAGLEDSEKDARRWARTERVVEPDPAWTGPADDRYKLFLELSDRGGL
jgi:xylulokinase